MSDESALSLFDLRERVDSLTRKDLHKLKSLHISPSLIEAIDFQVARDRSPDYMEAISEPLIISGRKKQETSVTTGHVYRFSY